MIYLACTLFVGYVLFQVVFAIIGLVIEEAIRSYTDVDN